MSNRLYNQFSYSPERQPINLMGRFTQSINIVAASLVNQGITYTAVTPGAAGNSITIHIVNPVADGALIIATVGTAITATLAKAAGVVTTDADALIAAINSDMSASALVSTSGTGSTPLVALATTPLAGGTNGAMTTNAMNMSMSNPSNSVYIIQLQDEFPEVLFASITLIGAGGSVPSVTSTSTAFGGNKTITLNVSQLATNDGLFIHLIFRNSANP